MNEPSLPVFLLLLLGLGAASLTACTVSALDDTDHADFAASAGAAIGFASDGSVTHSPALPVGNGTALVVTYDVRRLTTCGLASPDPGSGSSAAKLELFFMTRSGHAHVALGSDWADSPARTIARATIGPFPAADAGDLQIWARASNASGCEAWDSAGGHNYHFTIGDGPRGYTEIAPIIERACAHCHGSQFGTLDRVKTARTAMASRIAQGSMPRDNRAFKDTDDGRAVLAFLNGSAELR